MGKEKEIDDLIDSASSLAKSASKFINQLMKFQEEATATEGSKKPRAPRKSKKKPAAPTPPVPEV